MQLKVIKAFDWAHRGVQVERFEAGSIIDTEDEDLIRVSKAEGWADEDDGKAPQGKPSAGMKVDDLKTALAAKGIAFPEGAKKDELAALLDGEQQ
ncbi:HeH/LEM domain-containing protein [Delftia tsuruhatensis]